MEVEISPRAGRDLDDIWMFVAESAGISPADRLIDEMYDAVSRLRTMAHRGHVVAEKDGGSVRSLLVRRAWLLLFEASGYSVKVLRVVNARRDLAGVLAEID